MARGRLLVSAGIAALSALSQPYLDESYLESHKLRVDRADFDRVLNHSLVAGSRVGMVGFGGAVWHVARLAGQLVVTEAEPRFFRSHVINQQGVVEGPTSFRLLSTSKAQFLLASCDTVLITGCALASQALDELLAACRNSKIVVYGAGASLLPLPLFEYPQVTAVVTIRILDGPGLMNLLTNCGPEAERLLGEVSQALYIERAEKGAEAKPRPEPKAVSPPVADGKFRRDRVGRVVSPLRRA